MMEVGDEEREFWEEEYSGPVGRAVIKGLADEYGVGKFTVEVGDKGHVYVSLTPAGRALFGL